VDKIGGEFESAWRSKRGDHLLGDIRVSGRLDKNKN